jgi:hypothetical protein
MQSANRSAKLETMLKRLQTPRTAKGAPEEEAEEAEREEFTSGQNLIVPPRISPHDARILNLENAAAELMDNNRTVREDHAIAAVESHEHFQSNLKVVQISGIREGRPVVRSEWDGPATTMQLKRIPAPPSALAQHRAAARKA